MLLAYILLWISGLAAGFAVAHTGTGTHTGGRLAAIGYLAAVLIAALAWILIAK